MAEEYDAQSFVKGGSYLTSSHSLMNTLDASPGMLFEQKRNEFTFDLDISARASEDAYKLSQMDTDIQPGQYQSTFTPLFNTTNDAYARAAVVMGWKHFGLSYFHRATGDAFLNNPVYPNAKARILYDQGYSLGYGNTIKKVIYGFSFSTFKRKNQILDADVLKYNEGLTTTESIVSANEYNASLGYLITPDFLILTDYKKSTIDIGDRYFIGARYHTSRFNFYLEGHDLQNNNIENSLHYGLDYKLWILKLSAGMNQDYFTYGAAIDCKYFNLTVGKGGKNVYEQYRKEYDSYVLGLSFGYNL